MSNLREILVLVETEIQRHIDGKTQQVSQHGGHSEWYDSVAGRQARSLRQAAHNLRCAYTCIADAIAMGEGQDLPSLKDDFWHLLGRLSPENLTEDGELSATEQRRKEAVIMHRWHQVEQSLGRKVSLEEAEDWPHSHDVFGRPM